MPNIIFFFIFLDLLVVVIISLKFWEIYWVWKIPDIFFTLYTSLYPEVSRIKSKKNVWKKIRNSLIICHCMKLLNSFYQNVIMAQLNGYIVQFVKFICIFWLVGWLISIISMNDKFQNDDFCLRVPFGIFMSFFCRWSWCW